MEIGTSIFLSTTFLSLIILYVNTKDRWNWKRISKAVSFGGVGISVFIVVCIYWVEYQDNQPKVIHKFQGIELGYKRADVVFKLGEPIKRKKAVAELERREVSEDIQSLEEELDHLTAFPGREAEKEHLHYQNLIITLQNDKVIEIRYLCKSRCYKLLNKKRCDEDSHALNRIKCGESSEDVLRRYGSNIAQFNNKTDAHVRIYQSKKHNVSYMLRRDRIIALIAGYRDFNENEDFVQKDN